MRVVLVGRIREQTRSTWNVCKRQLRAPDRFVSPLLAGPGEDLPRFSRIQGKVEQGIHQATRTGRIASRLAPIRRKQRAAKTAVAFDTFNRDSRRCISQPKRWH